MMILVVVAKVPTLNKSKTRLIPAFGPDGALTLAQAMLSDTLRRFGDIPDCRRILYFAPANRADELTSWSASWELVPMPGHDDLRSSDLGVLLRAGYELVRDEENPTLFVGMDTPDLPLDLLLEARREAALGNAVVHPSTDGGYVLAALPPRCPSEVFDGVEWSTPRTAESQRASIAAHGIKLVSLQSQPWEDIDEIEDVKRLAARLANEAPGLCPLLERVLPDLLLLL